MATIAWDPARRGKILPDAIMKRTDLTVGAKVLYALLRDSAGKKDHCWPSQAYLALSLRQTIRSVQNHLKRLSELGLISIKKRPWRGNLYYITEQQVAALAKPVQTAPASASALPKAKTEGSPSGSFQTNSSAPYNRQAADAAFERLWSAYPRTEARKPAIRFWHRLSRAGSIPAVDDLLASIKSNQAHNPRWQRGYVPFLVTWLKDRRWEDPLPAAEAKPASASSQVQDQTNTVVLQKEKPPILELPENALARLKDALSLWPGSLNDSESAMVRVVWGRLYNENRLPSQQAIVDAVQSVRTTFTRWLHQLYLHGVAYSS